MSQRANEQLAKVKLRKLISSISSTGEYGGFLKLILLFLIVPFFVLILEYKIQI